MLVEIETDCSRACYTILVLVCPIVIVDRVVPKVLQSIKPNLKKWSAFRDVCSANSLSVRGS